MLYCKHTQAGVVEHVRDPALKVWTEAGQRALKASLSYSDTVGGLEWSVENLLSESRKYPFFYLQSHVTAPAKSLCD